MRTAFVALLGFAILTGLIMLRPSQVPNDDRMFIGTIQEILGGDTGCWFRFRHAADNDPIVFVADGALGETFKGLTNINNQDVSFDWIADVDNGSAYYNRLLETYIIVNMGPPQIDPKDKDCPDYPKATLTYSKHKNIVVVPVKGQCGCEMGMDEEEAKKFESESKEDN